MSDDRRPFRERWAEALGTAEAASADEYQLIRSPGGTSYAKRVGDEWEPISDDEARSAGVWRNPRGGQRGVVEAGATRAELSFRWRGRFDPRRTAGDLVARRLNLRCARCGTTLGHVDEHEKRILWHSVRSGRWWREPRDLKCLGCFEQTEPFSIDLDALNAALDRARHAARVVQVKIGAIV
jgi:hypothetical protein